MGSVTRAGSGFAALALLPALKIVDDSVVGTAVSLLVSELHVVSGIGFLTLLGYILIAEMSVRSNGNQRLAPENILSGIPPLVGSLLGGGMLLLWTDPADGFFELFSVIATVFTAFNRLLIAAGGEWLVYQEWWTYHVIANPLEDMSRLMTRSIPRATRWPFYLFLTAVTLSGTISENTYLDDEPILSRAITVGLLSIYTGLFALIISHNYFPSIDAVPWRATAIAGWTMLTVIGLLVYLATLAAFGDGGGLPVIPTLVVTFALGTFLATIDAFYPLPELLVIGVAVVQSLDPLDQRVPDRLTVGTSDIHSKVVSTTAACWERPVLLFMLLPVANGTLLAGWFLYAVYWLIPLVRESLFTTAIVWLLIVPIWATAIFLLWFWLRELPSIATPTRSISRPRGLLLTPAMVLTGYLVLSERPVLAGLLILCGVIGLGILSYRFFRYGWSTELPATVSIPVAYGVMTVPTIIVSWFATAGTTLFIGAIIAFPLSWVPLVYHLSRNPTTRRVMILACLVPLLLMLGATGVPTVAQFNNSVHAVFGLVLGLWVLFNPAVSEGSLS